MKEQRVIVLFLIMCSSQFPLCAQNLDSFNSARPRAYYVSVHGNDYSAGTRNHPLKTIWKVNKLKLVLGDTLYFRAKEAFVGPLHLQLMAHQNKPIVITSYGVGRATINGRQNEAMLLEGNHFTLKSINAKGWGRKGGNRTNGILITGADLHVENVNVEGFQKSGLQLFNCKGALIKNVKARYNGFCGIHVTGATRGASNNITLQNCAASNNPGDPTNLTSHSGNGILVGFSDSVLIDHCTATNNGWDMPRQGNGPVGIWSYESNRVIIQYCISYRNRTSKGGKDGGGFDFDGGMTNSIIQYCLSYENEGAGYGLFQYDGASPWHNNEVRYCISINDASTTEGSGSFFIWNGSMDSSQLRECLVYNNFVYTTVSSAVQFEPQSQNSNFCFYNNILLGTGKVVNGPSSGERFVGNVWWPARGGIAFRNYKSLVEWAKATGQEKMKGIVIGKQINPVLKGPFITALSDPHQLQSLQQFELRPTSPLKNQGLDLKTLFQIPYAPHDFYGNKVPQGKSVEAGIHEMEE